MDAGSRGRPRRRTTPARVGASLVRHPDALGVGAKHATEAGTRVGVILASHSRHRRDTSALVYATSAGPATPSRR